MSPGSPNSAFSRLPGSIRRVVLACEMIEDEVRLALETLPVDERPPVVWVESGLHDRPEQLNAALRRLIEALDEGAGRGSAVTLASVRPGRGPASERLEEVVVEPVEEVVLALGFCGKALQGLRSEHVTLVFPRVDDCISLLLSDGRPREEVPRNPRNYYLTRGWLCHKNSLTDAFESWAGRYGPERAVELRKAMFVGYERVGLIDTQAYDVAECVDRSRAYAEELDLEHVVVPGSIRLLERLFSGARDGEIVAASPGEAISLSHLLVTEDERA